MSQGNKGGQKAGTYLGGVRTVEDLLQRSRVDEETGCWRWGLSKLDGAAVVHFVDADGVRRKSRGRRAAAILSGKHIPKGHTVFKPLRCTHDDCVNPDHAAVGTRAQEGAAIAKSGRWKNLPTKIAATQVLADARRKLTPEAVHDIRTSGLSQVKLAEKHGVSQYCIWSVKTLRTHKPKGFSVFSLGAMA